MSNFKNWLIFRISNFWNFSNSKFLEFFELEIFKIFQFGNLFNFSNSKINKCPEFYNFKNWRIFRIFLWEIGSYSKFKIRGIFRIRNFWNFRTGNSWNILNSKFLTFFKFEIYEIFKIRILINFQNLTIWEFNKISEFLQFGKQSKFQKLEKFGTTRNFAIFYFAFISISTLHLPNFYFLFILATLVIQFVTHVNVR